MRGHLNRLILIDPVRVSHSPNVTEELGVVAHGFNPTLRRQRQEDL